ncbi:MAG: Maltose acetyltransferase [Candidatus Omnitrophica bacterium ADurb.Bin292]|nr:MAG: Maltose acetyltransferase [Candidatus Omnitrophica bacterium ADurb.Bin292]
MREYGKMIAGQLYNTLDPELTRMRRAALELCDIFNRSTPRRA